MSGPPLEIERVFLLRAMPDLPPGAEALRIEQGYLPEPGEGDVEGRLRRTTRPDGRVKLVHTVKKGLGLVREESERELDEAEFDRLWPRTAGRRLTKTRHVVPCGALRWEVDRFDGFDLVLAEIELPAPDTPVTLPAWLAPHVVREVTEEPAFRNYELARRHGR
jgi:CYTH domain-containing protein